MHFTAAAGGWRCWLHEKRVGRDQVPVVRLKQLLTRRTAHDDAREAQKHHAGAVEARSARTLRFLAWPAARVRGFAATHRCSLCTRSPRSGALKKRVLVRRKPLRYRSQPLLAEERLLGGCAGCHAGDGGRTARDASECARPENAVVVGQRCLYAGPVVRLLDPDCCEVYQCGQNRLIQVSRGCAECVHKDSAAPMPRAHVHAHERVKHDL